MNVSDDLATCVGYGEGRRGALLVHTGLLSCALSAVPLEQVERINAARRRVVLRHPSRAMPEGAFRDVRDRVVARS